YFPKNRLRPILGRVLGSDNFAKVYHAHSLSDNSSVAIKVIYKLKANPLCSLSNNILVTRKK
ncbi:hypothetical protein KSS87_003746, partial [Heliosperma pusillum]